MIEHMENLWHYFTRCTLSAIAAAITEAKFTFSAAFVLILNNVFNFLDAHSAAIGALCCIFSVLTSFMFKILDRRDKQSRIKHE